MTPLFTLAAVSVQFGRVQALSHCTLSVNPGETLALIGSNGSGKSTLLRTMHGLVRPASGQLQHDGLPSQAMLFQRPYMLRTSVLSNVALGLFLRGISWQKAKTEALQALRRVGLADLAQRNA